MEMVHLEQMGLAAMLILLRISGLMLFAPFLSSQSIPVPLKAVFTLALTALLYPAWGAIPPAALGRGWAAMIGGEFAIGLLLGLALQFIVEAAQTAGQILGLHAGFSLVTLLDPQTQADTPVLATFNQLVVLLIFLQLNLHHWLLRGLAASFAYLPPGTAVANLAVSGGLLQAAAGIWLVGVQIAAPVMAATMLVDVTLAFVAKASPQMPILFVGLSIKTLLALGMLAGSLMVWPRIFEHHFAAAIAFGERSLHLAR
jgi:flagellar biosynthetic protein FliR